MLPGFDGKWRRRQSRALSAAAKGTVTMGLDFAIDALYETGWSLTEPKDLPRHQGRPYPSLQFVTEVFAGEGLVLSVRHIQLFDCFRAEWRDAAGQVLGQVVGQSADEAAVYALSQLRRQLVATKAP